VNRKPSVAGATGTGKDRAGTAASKNGRHRRPKAAPPKAPSNNHVAPPQTEPPGLGQKATLLREAVQHPGVVEIVETSIQPGRITVTEIPETSLDPHLGIGGTPLEQDPDLMTVSLDRPGPHCWHELFPDKVLRTVLLAFKPNRNSSPDYHFLIPELQGPLKKHLKQVRVYLVFDASEQGGSFLWLMPETNFSPYYNTLASIWAKGDTFIRKHLFRFGTAERMAKRCDVEFRPRTPDDPGAILPSRPLSKLLPEALGPDHLITSTSHPVYVNLTSGRKLT
jgi:hypothetical protein